MSRVALKSIEIAGLRGVKSRLPLDLGGKSILIYGDNGSGKSSITDALEWFYRDRVEHLAGEEIGRDGLEALRNIFLDDKTPAVVAIQYTNSSLDAKKTIRLQKDSLKSEFSNTSPEFFEYLSASANENLFLRYRDLVQFIVGTKGDRLKHFSDIIGYSEVTDTKAVLKRAVYDIRREYRNKDFESQISAKQSHIIDNLGQNVTTDKQFIDLANKLLEPFHLPKTIGRLEEVEEVLKQITTPADSRAVELQSFYTRVGDYTSSLPKKFKLVSQTYAAYHAHFETILQDADKLAKLVLERLLAEGIGALRSGAIKEDKCPLCLQIKDRKQLLLDLERRAEELAKVKAERLKLKEAGESLKAQIQEVSQSGEVLLSDAHFKSEDDKHLREALKSLLNCLELYVNELQIGITDGKKLKAPEELEIGDTIANQVAASCLKKTEQMRKESAADKKLEVLSKIVLAKEAYLTIKKLKQQKKVYETQQNTLEVVYAKFVEKQKESIETFLSVFSKAINGLYEFMNPDENIKNIRVVSVEKEEELVGITLQFEFFHNDESPPHKYLSESHLNCLGIAFFVASAMAFNEHNRLLVMDDVISSFDSAHRKRFADLLVEKLSDYQIVLLTHERSWFEYVARTVKAKGWKLAMVKWSDDEGTHVDESPLTLKERIEKKVASNEAAGLANEMRIYLEHDLKEIALNLQVKVKYMNNEKNEDRMAEELLSDLRGSVNKHGDETLKSNPVFDRLSRSQLIANKGSHDSPVELKIGDLKAVWKDIKELETLFYCQDASCKEPCVSLRHYDSVTKKARCRCGGISLEWKGKVTTESAQLD
ncbi:MAG: hypothetical protein QUS33_14790 [Dehalococcoidia bacterium]|nr:hypothetical protein [Dehalococcoidia bacterium]